jgi:hypothetical protein
MKESPIFTRTYDLLRWLIPVTVKFPRQQRFVLAQAIQQSAFKFQDQLIEASMSSQTVLVLQQADISLVKLRTYLRLSRDLEILSMRQYVHVSKMVTEIGRLLGGWKKKAK